MYLGRRCLVGSHDVALRYMLQLRGRKQLLNEDAFNLWGMTQHCLQARQLIAKERDLDASPAEWTAANEGRRTDVKILADAFEITRLCTVAQDLEEAIKSHGSRTVPDTYLPGAVELKVRIEQVMRESGSRFDKFYCPHNELAQTLPVGPDGDSSRTKTVWLALLWNFFAAFQISLREAFISISKICCAGDCSEENLQAVKREELVVNKLANDILFLAVPIMDCPQGVMSARASLAFSLEVVGKSRYAETAAREMAAARREKLRTQHELQ